MKRRSGSGRNSPADIEGGANREKTMKALEVSAPDRMELISRIQKFSKQEIIMLGDLVADEFVYGEIARVSREAPVLILKQREKRIVPGGGANAVNNLADLGAKALPVGVVGDDEAGEELLRLFREKEISTRGVRRLRGYQTPTKSRILGGLSHWQRQQIVRVDREPAEAPPREIKKKLVEGVLTRLTRCDGILVSDYGYGTTDGDAAGALARKAADRGVPITVDSRFSLLTYSGFTAATPNEPEIEAAFGGPLGNNVDLLYRVGKMALRRLNMRALLITRGRDGVVLFEGAAKPRHIPIFGSDAAVDVTGAGDTVIAVFTLALAAGATFLHAAMLANVAGGLVVMKRGTATVTGAELREAIRNA
jgi:D-glycero-beta-D-manno-heptose-7-phosphate kinase